MLLSYPHLLDDDVKTIIIIIHEYVYRLYASHEQSIESEELSNTIEVIIFPPDRKLIEEIVPDTGRSCLDIQLCIK